MEQKTIEIKEDCFAYRDGKCNALNKLYCKEEKCKFYKTREQVKKEAKKYGK